MSSLSNFMNGHKGSRVVHKRSVVPKKEKEEAHVIAVIVKEEPVQVNPNIEKNRKRAEEAKAKENAEEEAAKAEWNAKVWKEVVEAKVEEAKVEVFKKPAPKAKKKAVSKKRVSKISDE